MSTSAHKLSRKLKRRRKALLKRYDDEDLHQLRVTIRRARALLKARSDRDSVAVRASLGKLARKTNPARDWDTLAIFAVKALSPQRWQLLQPQVEAHRQRARKKALTALRSDKWSRSLSRWQSVVDGDVGRSITKDAKPARTRRTARKALDASQLALSRGDEACWHSFRIAVKNLRYNLDSSPAGAALDQVDLKSVKNVCRALQDDLGDWHDAIVHQRLLTTIADDPHLAGRGEISAALESLDKEISAHGAEALARVRLTMARDGHALAALAGQKVQQCKAHMALEIERKFLVCTARLGSLENGEHIRQGFIATADLTAVRVRTAGERAWLTIKGENKGAVRLEFEYAIPINHAQKILDQLCSGPAISKTRYRRQFRGYEWEIDVFHGENSGLVVAEVELRSERDEPELPDWVLEEVTSDPRYYNVNLVACPYSQWRNESV